MDEHGYPTDEELERLEDWPLNDIEGAFAFAKSLWWISSVGVAEANGVLYLATGGWSGNEAVIKSMKQNLGIYNRWISSSRGGAHEFELTMQSHHRKTRFNLEQELIESTAELTAALQRAEQAEARIVELEQPRMEMADSSVVDYLAAEVDQLLPLLGVEGALVTDLSRVGDFPDDHLGADKYVWQAAIDLLREKNKEDK